MVLQSTANTPKKMHKDSVAITDFAKSNSVEQGATTSAPCETSNPVTNLNPFSGMFNHVDDNAHPLAVRRTHRPLKPLIILDL